MYTYYSQISFVANEKSTIALFYFGTQYLYNFYWLYDSHVFVWSSDVWVQNVAQYVWFCKRDLTPTFTMDVTGASSWPNRCKRQTLNLWSSSDNKCRTATPEKVGCILYIVIQAHSRKICQATSIRTFSASCYSQILNYHSI